MTQLIIWALVNLFNMTSPQPAPVQEHPKPADVKPQSGTDIINPGV